MPIPYRSPWGDDYQPVPVAPPRAPGAAPARPPQGPAAPSAPPGAPATNPIPGGAITAERKRIAKLAYDRAKAKIQQNRGRLYKDYGFLENGQVDPNNPFGAYQQQRLAHSQERMGTEEDILSRGLNPASGGYTGGLIQNLMQSQGLKSYELGRDFLRAGEDLTSEELDADTQYQTDILGADREALDMAIQDRDYQPVGDQSAQDSADIPPARRTLARSIAAARRTKVGGKAFKARPKKFRRK